MLRTAFSSTAPLRIVRPGRVVPPRRSLITAAASNGKMVKATWNGTVLAESDKTEKVEGNHYFPPDSIKQQYFKDSAKTTSCGWKGLANYKIIEVDGKVNEDAAWYYATPKSAAENIKGYYAFWRGVEVS